MNTFKLQDFDRKDPKNIGRPAFFDVDQFLFLVEQFIIADEIGIALQMLENMPAWYRKHTPSAVTRVKERLLTQLFTDIDYAHDGCKIKDIAKQSKEDLKAGIGLERLFIAYNTVKDLNGKGIKPWIYELGPGSFHLPFVLASHDLDFGYKARSLNAVMEKEAAIHLTQWREKPEYGQKKVFIAFELLEHLLDPKEIHHHYVKAGGDFDIILMSTPCGVWAGGMNTDWAHAALGHVKPYNQDEFLAYAHKTWPTHKWTLFEGPVMVIMGVK